MENDADNDSSVIRQVSPEITTISTGGRATIVRLESGALVVISPVALTASSRQAIASIDGDVKYIIAPNLEHYRHIGAWKAEFPGAYLIVPQGLPEKWRTKPALGDLRFDAVIAGPETISPEFDKEFSFEYVDAIASHEIILLHKPQSPTSTLIEADFLFNIPAKEQFSKTNISATSGFINNLITARVFSAEPPSIWQKRLGWYVLGANDRSNFKASVQRIYEWDFDRIIPCHGDVMETGVKQVFAAIFEWYLIGKN
ncbi:uncharacterized protein B0J16DRAFT_363186 [Fusarium flagelliforme]|uniref:uncharacterized protein n=1 Tax=Fusarium flagelliforme TaxID=2675880 RepID=UPI001E8E2BB5|nr:uncharacterized protein B0J16DRAFT_363186 [Fusarium flagelliforme]KAH7186187.1 hypothetical protein B0J16DRAFT_363186 [Fusarium flagelliforme]